MTTPLISFVLALLAASSVYANGNNACSYVASKKADLKVINDYDDYLVDTFHQRNRDLVTKINAEAMQVFAHVRNALFIKSKDVKSLAIRLKNGQTVAQGTNVQRMLDAKIMRQLPPYLNRAWFYQDNFKDGKTVLGPIFTWPEDTIRKVATDELPSTFRATGIRQIRAAGKGYVPVINNPRVESGITVTSGTLDQLTDPKLGLRPFEIAIYGTLKTKETATQYPPTHVNNNVSKPDSYYLEYSTTIYVLDIATGNIRYVNSQLPEYHTLAGRNMGAARIVSDMRMQRISLDREIAGCN